MQNRQADISRKNRRLLLIALVVVVAMFGFGYALVPLYNALCAVLGVNGKTSTEVAEVAQVVDKARDITVQFLATNNENLPWTFHPKQVTITLHPGENKRVVYFAKNNSDHTMTIQAVPSVSPGVAAKYLKKTECFCFNQQTLKSKEAVEMPVLFHIDTSLPTKIHTISLSYTLFDVTGKTKHRRVNKRGKIS